MGAMRHSLRWARRERLVVEALEPQLRDFLANEALDVAHVGGVFGGDERERVSDRLRAELPALVARIVDEHFHGPGRAD